MSPVKVGDETVSGVRLLAKDATWSYNKFFVTNSKSMTLEQGEGGGGPSDFYTI